MVITGLHPNLVVRKSVQKRRSLLNPVPAALALTFEPRGSCGGELNVSVDPGQLRVPGLTEPHCTHQGVCQLYLVVGEAKEVLTREKGLHSQLYIRS